MSFQVFEVLLLGLPAVHLALGAYLLVHYFDSAPPEPFVRHWVWFWVAGLVLSAAGYAIFWFGGIWLILLGTIGYAVAALRSRRRLV